MRSKQQPRPSYRWSNESENGGSVMETITDLTDGPHDEEVIKEDEGKENILRELAPTDEAPKVAKERRAKTLSREVQRSVAVAQMPPPLQPPPLTNRREGNGCPPAASAPPTPPPLETSMEIINRFDSSSSSSSSSSASCSSNSLEPGKATEPLQSATETSVANDDVANNGNKLAADMVNCLDKFTGEPQHPLGQGEEDEEEVATHDEPGMADEQGDDSAACGSKGATNGIHHDDKSTTTTRATTTRVTPTTTRVTPTTTRVTPTTTRATPTTTRVTPTTRETATTTTRPTRTSTKTTTTTKISNSNVKRDELHGSQSPQSEADSSPASLELSPPARQASNEARPPHSQCELASPRCLSRESNQSGAPHDGRCPSNDSHCSGNESNHTELQRTTPPSNVGLPLTASLGPAAAAAAAALLPSPQSAAMAAYLNAAAAAAAQQNHLLLAGNPLASLVHQAQVQGSPRDDGTRGEDGSADTNILDFSKKTRRSDSENASEAGDDQDDSNLDKSSQGGQGSGEEANATEETMDEANNSPLDLSVGSGRKRQVETDDEGAGEEEGRPPRRKMLRPSEYKTPSTLPPGTWVPPINPYLAAVAAASFSPNTPVTQLDCWNASKPKISPNEATKALEKMTEMTRLGAATSDSSMARQGATASSPSTGAAAASGGGGRHSAWQSHWLNKGADAAKDVFKCVWCKQSFPTLASLTTHMKETQHCGVNMPSSGSGGSSSAPSTAANASSQSRSSGSMPQTGGSASRGESGSSSGGSGKSDLNLLIKETMPLPRKLVRGQDVWLGKGAEQTRQILKCMWCGQSFRSLAEMTSHMQETQHYTNIISQEQIISWKSNEDKAGGGGGGGSGSGGGGGGSTSTPPSSMAASPPAPTGAAQGSSSSTSASANQAANATVAAVLTCKVCDQAFATLKDLSNHMVKHNHYKDAAAGAGGVPMPRPSTAESPQIASRRGRQAREKRKKSLPVRKLLELERAQQDFKLNNSLDPALKPLRDFAASTKITCEKCGDKIETALFVDHIRQCLGNSIPIPPRNHNNNNMKSSYHHERLQSPRKPTAAGDEEMSLYKDKVGPHPPPPSSASSSSSSSSTPSVLNALEQLIEKSFDTRSRQSGVFGGGGATQPNTPLGASILKRLGIDDSVDYTKPLMDPQTMHFLRSYSNYGPGGGGGGGGMGGARDRSASESSSVSERCSSRLESMTPERNSELSRQATPRLTPDKPVDLMRREQQPDSLGVKIKTEPSEESGGAEDLRKAGSPKISVKKEFTMPVDVERPVAVKEEKDSSDFEKDLRASSSAAASPAMSPSASERSRTPQDKKSLGPGGGGSSLTALSSMFDNLGSSKAAGQAMTGETNNNNSSSSKPSKKSNANPLAALQKLCETTDPPAANTRSNNTPSSSTTPTQQAAAAAANGAGGMVAFSWACNEAVMTSADSIIKCSFCDTPFCSKGAYRHHLSKVHFVKEDGSMDQAAMKSPASRAISPKSPKTAGKSPASHRGGQPSPASAPRASPSSSATSPAATINPFNESPQSKFLKYTELAKQLSSKNA